MCCVDAAVQMYLQWVIAAHNVALKVHKHRNPVRLLEQVHRHKNVFVRIPRCTLKLWQFPVCLIKPGLDIFKVVGFV